MAGRLPGPRAGKTLDKGVDQTWAYLFAQNEERYFQRKENPRALKPRTDEQLTEFMVNEFPLTPEQEVWLKKNKRVFRAFNYPTAKRSRYNAGKLSGMEGKIPEQLSHRYDGQGERITGYRPRKSTQVS